MRKLHEIAREIRADWKTINYAARPYLEAMACLDSITDRYGADNARGVVLYFLCNAGAWRGDTARRIKSELKEMAR